MIAEGLLSEEIALVATVDPQVATPEAYPTDAIDMRYWRRLLFTLLLESVAATATVDFKLQASADGSTNWTDLADKEITQILTAGADGQAHINLQAEEVKIDDEPARYVRGLVTVGTANASICVAVYGARGRYGTASHYDLSSVAEIVA